MNICFLARPCFDKFSTMIFNCLKEKYRESVVGVFITSNKEESDYVRQAVPNGTVCETSKYLRENWDSFDEQDLVEFEKKYDCAPIWKYIYTDRFLINRDYEYVVKVTVGLFRFFEDVYTNNAIDFYYSEAIATLQCYIAYLVGKKMGVRYISQMNARGGMDATHHYFLMDEYQYIYDFDINYKEKQYPDAIREMANSFLREFETKDVVPKNMIFTGNRPRFKASFLLLPIKRWIKSMSSYNRDKFSYMYYGSAKYITDPVVFYFKYLKARKFYSVADYDRKYVYFPLHYQPEASTIVCAQKYEKQLYFIDSWAKSLPADTVLYVKEHYAFLGHRDISFYKDLQKYPNVVLLDPWESSRKLIENAVAVTTLTGTAGWEAILLRKPVFLGGKIFFDNAPGVIRSEEIFNHYLDAIESWKQPTREELLQYLCEYVSKLHEGNIYAADPATLNEKNIRNVAYSLYEEMEKLLLEG